MSNYHRFTKIDRVLKNTTRNYKLDKTVEKHKLLKVWQEIAKAFVNEAVHETRAVNFEKGVLFIACLSKEIAYQIKTLSSRIIHALNELMERKVVYAIQIEY